MDNPKDWKKKYQNIIHELESKEEIWGNLETLLRKAIGRLSIAGQGIDASLDKQLKDIRTLSRNKTDDKLSTALDTLSDVLNTIDEQASSQNNNMKDELSTINDVMSQLLTLLAPPKEHQSTFDRIKSHLPPKNTDSILTELAEELNLIMASPLSNNDASKPNDIGDVILSLLDRLSIVPGMNQKAKDIQTTIRSGLTLEQWPIVLDKIAKEVSTALQLINDEKNELEHFIAQVTEQLVEITGYISVDQLEQKNGLSDTKDFHQQMNKEVIKMHENVHSASDIESLKQVLDENIHSLKDNIAGYLTRGKSRFNAAETRNQALSAQVIHMEKETQDLKKRLDENKQKLIFDTLTGIYNRMAYNDHIKKLMARWQRYEEQFCYAIIDIDHFKRVNDTYGHNTGDKVLKLVATIMQKNIRESDTLFRIGGEEFVLILPNTDIDQAAPTIEKIREAVGSSGFRFKEDKVVIHISAGLTQVNESDSEESLYERADKGLYQAKETGRNKLVKI